MPKGKHFLSDTEKWNNPAFIIKTEGEWERDTDYFLIYLFVLISHFFIRAAHFFCHVRHMKEKGRQLVVTKYAFVDPLSISTTGFSTEGMRGWMLLDGQWEPVPLLIHHPSSKVAEPLLLTCTPPSAETTKHLYIWGLAVNCSIIP